MSITITPLDQQINNDEKMAYYTNVRKRCGLELDNRDDNVSDIDTCFSNFSRIAVQTKATHFPPNKAWASSTRSFQPGATSLIGPLCCVIGTPRPSSNSPARASAV